MNLPGKLKEIWAAHRTEGIMALVGLVLVGGGVFWWRTLEEEEVKVEIVNRVEDPTSSEASLGARLVIIDISGAVNKPGCIN